MRHAASPHAPTPAPPPVLPQRLAPPPAVRVISLDLDDTLWPAAPVLAHAEAVLAQWLEQHARSTARALDAPMRQRIAAQVRADHPDRTHDLGFLRRESLRRALAACGDDPQLSQPAFEVFLKARQAVTLFDDVIPVLSQLARRYRLVALTNGNADVMRIGLGSLFRASVAAHEVGVAKPDARIFHEACRLMQVSPEEVLHVGDDPVLDVQAARNAGLHGAWLCRPQLSGPSSAQARPGPEVPVFEGLHALHRWLCDGALDEQAAWPVRVTTEPRPQSEVHRHSGKE